MTPSKLLLLGLYLTHGLSIATWIGVMLFNLIVNFPNMRARARDAHELTAMMSAQARRAGPWLYLLIALTLMSGLAIAVLSGHQGGHQGGDQAGHRAGLSTGTLEAKVALLVAMLCLHLWATLHLWPRIHFALPKEWPGLFLRYQVTIGVSSACGIAAMAVSYWSHVCVAWNDAHVLDP